MGDSGAQYKRRIWRRADDRPQAKRKQHPCHAGQQARVYPPRVALPPHQANQTPERRVFRRPLGYDRPQVAPVYILTNDTTITSSHPQTIRMFNQQELQVLLGGVNTPIDIDDLRRHTNYGGLFNEEHATIRAFWKVRHARGATGFVA